MLKIAEHFPTPAQIGFEDEEKAYILEHCPELNNDEYYIDYFNDYRDFAAEDDADLILHQNKIKEVILSSVTQTKSLSVLKKMEWAILKFNLSKYIDGIHIQKIDFRFGKWRKLKMNIYYFFRKHIKKMFSREILSCNKNYLIRINSKSCNLQNENIKF
jgi:hypothetical protein